MKVFPKSPTSADELHDAFDKPEIMEAFGYSRIEGSRGKFYKGTIWKEQKGCAFFASDSVIELIEKHVPSEKRDYACDSTFRIVPVGCFRQLLIIHVKFQRRMIPLIYVLMTNKTEALYKATFNFIEQRIYQLRPTSFTVDYERAQRNAIRSIYIAVVISNCWFHYTQSVRKRGSQIDGFFALVNKYEELSDAYHMILALPLLPAEHIGEVFATIKVNVQSHGQHEMFARFLQYVEKQWLKNVRKIISEIGRCTTYKYNILKQFCFFLKSFTGNSCHDFGLWQTTSNNKSIREL